MKTVLLRNLIILGGLLLLQSLPLQAQFSLTGEIRPRAEFRNGFKTIRKEGADPAFFIEQRTRLYAQYKKDKLSLGITLQDVRIWGSVGQVYKEDPSLNNVSEAWGEYSFTKRFSVKAGRQILAYDNDRILGSLNWAQQSRSHDLVLFKYADSTWQFHIGAAFNQDASKPEYAKTSSTYYNGVANYKTMQFAWFHKEWSKSNLSLLFLNNGLQVGPDSASAVRFSQTLGGIFQTKMGQATLQAEFYQQTGKNAADKGINAQLMAANVTFPLSKGKLTVGVDYLSGTAYDETQKDNAFNPLYGTHHKFYGFMDYFYVGNGHLQKGKTTGLIDVYVNPSFKLSSKVTFITAVHQFFSPVGIYTKNVPDLTTQGDKKNNLGTELDFVLNVNLAPEVNLKAGYSQLIPSSSLKSIKTGGSEDFNNWAWLMMTFKPTFL